MRKLSIIIPVKNEEEKLSNIIKEVKKLDPFEILVIVNGSTDQTKQIAVSLNCKVIEYTEPLGHDIGRAIGAFYAKGDILLFIDGDIVIPHQELLPFINAIEEGHDIVLNNLESILELNQRPHSVSIAKMAINDLFGNSDLSINSLVAIPHAISRYALQEIGWRNLGEPPRAQGIAMKKKLLFSCPTFVDVISKNKIRKELHLEQSLETPYNPMEDIIFGDHLSAVQYLISGYGERGEWVDNKNREILKNIKIGKRKKFVKRSAVVSFESNENVNLLIDIIKSLRKAGAEEIIVLSSNNLIKKINIYNPIVKVIPLEVNVGSYINRAIGAAFSSGENILFTDDHVLSSAEDYKTLFREMEKGGDVALFDRSDILDRIQPIDELNALQYFLNIILRKPEFFNNGLTYTPHVISKEVIEQVGYSSLMIPALAYVKIIENNYNISLVCSDQKGLTARKNEHLEILLGDHVEAIQYFLSKTNGRGNFSSGKKNFRVLDELSKNHNLIGKVFDYKHFGGLSNMSKMNERDWEMIQKMGYPEEISTEGLYRGGEKTVEQLLGGNKLLPYLVEEIIEAGIQSLSSQIIELRNSTEIEKDIRNALIMKKGFSLIRMGDGELTTLAHDIILSTEEISLNPSLNFLPYAGVTLPDHPTRDRLAKHMLEADVVGIPTPRWPTYQQMFIRLAKYHKWPLKEMVLTNSVINYELHLETNLFHDLLTNYNVLLIGNRMKEGEELLKSSGYNKIVGSIPVENIKSVPLVLEEVEKYEYDIALVSAGISANLICVELAKKDKVAIDFGHLIDELINKTKTIQN